MCHRLRGAFFLLVVTVGGLAAQAAVGAETPYPPAYCVSSDSWGKWLDGSEADRESLRQAGDCLPSERYSGYCGSAAALRTWSEGSEAQREALLRKSACVLLDRPSGYCRSLQAIRDWSLGSEARREALLSRGACVPFDPSWEYVEAMLVRGYNKVWFKDPTSKKVRVFWTDNPYADD
jgi:hypothetical protein